MIKMETNILDIFGYVLQIYSAIKYKLRAAKETKNIF